MGMIRKEVTGSGEALKQKSNPKTAMGAKGPNVVLKKSEGYMNQGPMTMGDVSHSRSFTKAGARGGISAKVSTAKEDVTNGMGGRVIKDMN
jgi:hypothetical protein